MSTNSKKLQVGFHVNNEIRVGLEINLSGANMYGNFLPKGKANAHFSYHEGGELHFKNHQKYLEWKGGISGNWEPMKFERTPTAEVENRQDISTGWETAKLETVLPVYNPASGKDVHAFEIPESQNFLIMGLIVSIIGSSAIERQDDVGLFWIFDRHRFSNGILTAEIEAFGVPHDVPYDPKHDNLDYGLD
jgi:hypothetical protein